MKLGLAIQQVSSAESDLAEELHKVGERHKTDQEVYHLTRTLANISRKHIEELARYNDRYEVSVDADDAEEEEGRLSGLLDPVREKGSELMGRRPTSGMLLLRDLRQLSRLASEVSINWVILGQGAQAVRDRELLQTVKQAHDDNLRQLKWANTMIKQISPQVLTS